MCTVATDQVAGKDLISLTAVEVPCYCHDAVLGLLEAGHRCTAQDAQIGKRCRACEQHGFEIDLINPMRWLGRWPPGIWATFRPVAFGPTGNRDAPELDSGRCRSEGDVVGIVGGQASVAHGTHHAKATEDLHRTCADVVASHARRLAGSARLGDGYTDATSSEVHGQRQADRPAADN